jgi:hypothetical protein
MGEYTTRITTADCRSGWCESEVGIVRDAGGYLVTGPDLVRNGCCPAHWPLDREPYYLETRLPGRVKRPAKGDIAMASLIDSEDTRIFRFVSQWSLVTGLVALGLFLDAS